MDLGLNLLCALWILGIILLIIIPLQISRRRPWKAPDRCPFCRYDTRSLPETLPCPECGKTRDAAPRRRLSTQGYLSAGIPLGSVVLIGISLLPHGMGAALVGLMAAIPMVVLAFILINIESNVSPRGMAVLTLSATLPAAGIVTLALHALFAGANGQAAIGIFASWFFALGASGLGLGIALPIERWLARREENCH
jgi:hypothetical protein